MSELRLTDRGSVFDHASGEWRARVSPAHRTGTGGVSPGLVIAGAAALALGALAWYHFGPDVRRYIKMERM